MEIIRDEVVFDGKFIRTIRRFFRNRNGSEGVWEMIERKTFGSGVCIIAVTPENNVILERGYRIPLKNFVIEMPAGLMDIAGESELEAAKRELMEETGYTSNSWKFLIKGPFNSGLVTDQTSLFIAKNVKKTAKPNFDDAENIELIEVPASNLYKFLESQKNDLVDVKLFSIIPFLEKEGIL